MATAKVRHLPEYPIWANMKGRCYTSSNTSYKNYGARGIKVCERWRNSFRSFLEDMGSRPNNTFWIERINNDGDYEPSNCKWIPRAEQIKNRRMSRTNKTGYVGVFLKVREHRKPVYEAYITRNYQRVYLGCYKTLKEAVSARKRAEI